MSDDSRTKLEQLILKSVELPVLPATTQKVMALLADPEVSVEKVKRFISADPGLTTKILQVSNSAFYGTSRSIPNLTQAIMRLGLNAVRNIAVATSMKNVYKRFGLAEKLLWEQMMGSAIASSVIARHTRVSDAEDAFIGGLLHDVGKVVLNNESPEEFARVMERVYNEGVSFVEAEREVFDFSHREVGALVVKMWGFPERLETLLRDFENQDMLAEDRYMYNLVSVIIMSDRVCQKFGVGWRRPAGDEVDFGNLAETLGLDDDEMDELIGHLEVTLSQGLSLY